MSTKQQPEASKRRCGAVQSEQAEKMMIVTDDHRSNCEQMEGKERADEHIISNKLTSNDKQNSNDSGKPGSNQQKLLDIQSSKATTSAASTSKVSSAASTSKMASAASTSKMASSKAVLTSKVTKPTTSTAASATAVSSSFPAPVLPFSTDDLPDGLPVLCIHRLYRDETGAEYRHTEVVDHPQVIDNYLKLRTLVGLEQLRHYAFSGSESLQDFKQFKRKIGKRLAYHGQKQQQQRKIDEAMKRKPQQQQGCSSSTVGETGVQLELGASRNKLQSQSSLPANSQSQPPPNKKIIKMEPSAHTCASHCRACGQKGHIRTNKICPKHPANQQQLNTIKEEANAENVNDDSGGGQSKKAVNELAKLPNADLLNQSANPPAAPAKGTKPVSTAAATVVKMEPTTDQRQSTGSSGYDTSSSNLADDQKHNSPKAASCTSKDTGGHARLARAATTAAVPVLTGLRRGRKRRCCSPRIEEQQPQQQHVLEKCLREK